MKEVIIEELNVQPDHIHLYCSIPPKLSISSYMVFLKGKTAIKILRSYPMLRKKTYWGNHFWSRGILSLVKYQEEQEGNGDNRNSGQNTLF